MFMAEADKIHLMNMKNGAILDTYSMGDEKTPWRASLYSNIYVSSDTQWLAMGDTGGTVHLWDVESGKKLKTYPEKGDGTSFVLFTPDKKRMWTTGTDDGTVRLTEVATGREIASFISFRDGEWAVLTPEGYYNASPNGEKYINVRVGSVIHGVAKFRESFFRPDLVKFALQGGSLSQLGNRN
jgi:WD40 repeat protein